MPPPATLLQHTAETLRSIDYIKEHTMFYANNDLVIFTLKDVVLKISALASPVAAGGNNECTLIQHQAHCQQQYSKGATGASVYSACYIFIRRELTVNHTEDLYMDIKS